MQLAVFVGLTSLCGITLLAGAGCGDAGPGSPAASTTLPPKNGVYSVQLESNTQPTCSRQTAGETAMITSTDTLETCVAGSWVTIPCLVGGAVAFDSATDSLWACTENTDGGAPIWAQITLPQGPTGPQGPQGPKGDAGATGATGLQGPAGTNGTNGADGSTGATGPQGPAGTNGSPGVQGPQGDAGSNALIVQTPFAGAAGTPAQNTACPNGGTEIDTGIDDGTGAFVGTPTVTYVCNGASNSGAAPVCNAASYTALVPNLAECDLAGVRLAQGASLTDVNLTGAYLTGAFLDDVDLSGANLTGANVIGAILDGANLSGANLTGANLYDTQLESANLAGANLIYTNLTNAQLTGATLTNARLSAFNEEPGANLTGVSSGSILGTPATLPSGWLLIDGYLIGPGANLSNANLSGVDMSGVDLSGANLNGANLSNANLSDANLTGAELAATLTGANLSSANLGSAVDLSLATLTHVIWDNAICPDGTSSGDEATGTCVNN